MTRILIADCWSAAMQGGVIALGAPLNAAMFEQALRLHEPDIECVPVNIADTPVLPAGMAIGDFDGVVLTGSPLHIGDCTPEVMSQIAFARAVFETDVAVWGSCWGLQLAAAALGGAVRTNPNGREIGVARGITITEAGRGHPLLAGRAPVFEALCSHLDEVETLPPGAQALAENGVSGVQAMAARSPGGGTLFAVQYHPELTVGYIGVLFDLLAPVLAAEGFGLDAADVRQLADGYRTLDADTDRRDLAWRFGIGADILEPRRRTAEFGNWLRGAVHRT
jgi:GMP synthase (glutamine-hydrolysing)